MHRVDFQFREYGFTIVRGLCDSVAPRIIDVSFEDGHHQPDQSRRKARESTFESYLCGPLEVSGLHYAAQGATVLAYAHTVFVRLVGLAALMLPLDDVTRWSPDDVTACIGFIETTTGGEYLWGNCLDTAAKDFLCELRGHDVPFEEAASLYARVVMYLDSDLCTKHSKGAS